MTDNMKLWDSVFATDPAATKKFTKGGGFSGTAIKPFWLIKRATETFGPVGIGWGWEEMENKVVGGVWCSKVRLWYDLKRGSALANHFEADRGRIEQWGQTVMEGTNKNGAFVDEEAPKKAVTDAVTKCLSYLGFGGDVHMGRFDDSKYVEEAEKHFREEAKKETAKSANAEFEAFKNALAASDDPDATWLQNGEFVKKLTSTSQEFLDLRIARENRKAEIASFGAGFATTQTGGGHAG